MFKQLGIALFRYVPAVAVMLAVCSVTLAQRAGATGGRVGVGPQGQFRTQPNNISNPPFSLQFPVSNNASNGTVTPFMLNNGTQTFQPNQFPAFQRPLPSSGPNQFPIIPPSGSMTNATNQNTTNQNTTNQTNPNQFNNTNPNQFNNTNPNQGFNTNFPPNSVPDLNSPFGFFPLGFGGSAGISANYLDLGNNTYQNTQNYNSPNAQNMTPPAPPQPFPAIVTVRAPNSAEVWVQDQKLEQNGEDRKFISPALPANRTVSYNVRASWYEDGETVTATQQIQVKAGDQKRVTFFDSSSSSSQESNSQPTPPAPSADQDTGAARIEMHVPAGAQVWIEGKKMTSTGDVRRFVSPRLTPGQAYTYDIRVSWNENGREVRKDRQVTLRAGDQQKIEFPSDNADGNKR